MTAHCIHSEDAPTFCINCGRRHTGTCDATTPWVREMRPMEPTDAEKVKILERRNEEQGAMIATAHAALLAATKLGGPRHVHDQITAAINLIEGQS